eukprot:1144956-Pelagomonas_calceolata.AAC.1
MQERQHGMTGRVHECLMLMFVGPAKLANNEGPNRRGAHMSPATAPPTYVLRCHRALDLSEVMNISMGHAQRLLTAASASIAPAYVTAAGLLQVWCGVDRGSGGMLDYLGGFYMRAHLYDCPA